MGDPADFTRVPESEATVRFPPEAEHGMEHDHDSTKGLEDVIALVADTVVAGTAAGLALLAGAGAGVAATTAAPGASMALRAGVTSIIHRRRRQAATALERAAAQSETTPLDVVTRLADSPEGLSLLASGLNAAAEAALHEKLYAVGVALGNGALYGATIDIETLFVKALGDIEAAHIRVLRLFTQTSNELGFGDGGPDFDSQVSTLNSQQLRHAAPDLAALLGPITATLSRHGLIANLTAGGGSFFGGGGQRITTFEITDFGLDCLDRLRQAPSQALGPLHEK
jgi:hypothetical protein